MELGAGEMTQQIREMAAFPGNLGSVPRIYLVSYSTLVPEEADTFFLVSTSTAHMHRHLCRQNIHIHKIKTGRKKEERGRMRGKKKMEEEEKGEEEEETGHTASCTRQLMSTKMT